MKFRLLLLVTVALTTIAVVPSVSLEIKLASPAPEQSPWGAALNQMAADWQRISGGRIRLRVYHNGIAGDESDVLRKMRIGQIQAAVLTSTGMKQIVPDVFSVSVPFMIRSDETLRYVLDRIEPDLEEQFRENRMHVLAWSHAGWIYFFSREPVSYPTDLRPQRLASDPGDEELLQTFKTMGFSPIPITQSEIITALNSGMIDAFYSSPIGAAGFQWFGPAPNMLDLKVAPFLGSILITDSAWRRVDDDLKTELIRSARTIAAQIDNDVHQLETDAITTMVRYGLHVQEVTPEIEDVWRRDVAKYEDAISEVYEPVMTRRIRSILSESPQ